MSTEPNVHDLIDRLAKLYVSVVADCLDAVGIRDHIMDYRLRPIYPGATIAGQALTVTAAPAAQIPAVPYLGEFLAVEALKPGQVMVVTTNGCQDAAYWGELLSTAARFRGAVGAIIEGFTRDARLIEKMQFPVFALGMHPGDSKGRLEVIAHNVPIRCGGVLVNPGDLVLADVDGIVCVPLAVAEEVISLAEAKASGENVVRAELAKGRGVVEVYNQYGIL